jgi:hypothetical protein
MPRKRVESQQYRYTATQIGESVDPDTGEVHPLLALYEPVAPMQTGRPKNTRTRITSGRTRRVTKNFAYVDTESMAMLDLSHQEYRVFSFMMSKMEQPSGEIRVTGAYIARSIHMTAVNVSKTLKSLRERLIIIPEGHGSWRMNSWIMWMGDYKKWYPAAVDDEEPYWTAAELEAERPVLTIVDDPVS